MKHIGFLATVSLIAVGCMAPLDEEASGDPPPAVASSAGEGGANLALLRHYDLDTGQLEIFSDDHGGILLSENISQGHLGEVERMLAERRTPLELYRELDADTDWHHEVPAALIDHHALLETFQQPEELSPASIYGPTLDISAGADCTQASDLPWFRTTWKGLGHRWRYYYNKYLSPGATQATPLTGLKTEFMTHMCNYSITGGNAYHRISQGYLDTTTTVPVGVRHLYFWSSPSLTTNYQGSMTNGTFDGGNAKLGGSSP